MLRLDFGVTNEVLRLGGVDCIGTDIEDADGGATGKAGNTVVRSSLEAGLLPQGGCAKPGL